VNVILPPSSPGHEVVRAFGGGAAPKICCQATKPFVVLVCFVVKRRFTANRHLGLFHPITPTMGLARRM
jgi:hypothetical protein